MNVVLHVTVPCNLAGKDYKALWWMRIQSTFSPLKILNFVKTLLFCTLLLIIIVGIISLILSFWLEKVHDACLINASFGVTRSNAWHLQSKGFEVSFTVQYFQMLFMLRTNPECCNWSWRSRDTLFSTWKLRALTRWTRVILEDVSQSTLTYFRKHWPIWF
jgi:hypothetical protein